GAAPPAGRAAHDVRGNVAAPHAAAARGAPGGRHRRRPRAAVGRRPRAPSSGRCLDRAGCPGGARARRCDRARGRSIHRDGSASPRMGGAAHVLTLMDDRREIVGWVMYDWANSAYQTTVLTVLAGPYLTAIAQQAAGKNGIVLRLWPAGHVTAKSLYPYCVSLSVFARVLVLPLIGAAADSLNMKKQIMAFFCYVGSVTTCLFLFATEGRHLLGALLLIVSNVSFGITIVLYNAFLNDIASP